MEEEKKVSKEDINNQIKTYQIQIKQAEKELALVNQDKELQEKKLQYKRDHHKLIDGKPEWLLYDEFMEMELESMELQHTAMMAKVLDNIAQMNMFIKKRNDEIVRLRRNHKPRIVDEVVEEEKKDE